MPLGTNPGHTAVQKMRDPNRSAFGGQVQFLGGSVGPDRVRWTFSRRRFLDDDRSHDGGLEHLTLGVRCDARGRDFRLQRA